MRRNVGERLCRSEMTVAEQMTLVSSLQQIDVDPEHYPVVAQGRSWKMDEHGP